MLFVDVEVSLLASAHFAHSGENDRPSEHKEAYHDLGNLPCDPR